MKILLYTAAILSLTACSAPVKYKTIELNQKEVREERVIQKKMAKQQPANKFTQPKLKDTQFYQTRLQKVGAPLLLAIHKMCDGKCNYKLHISDKKKFSAWAKDTNVYINPTLMDFLEDDRDLAFILSHELAHVFMEHRKIISNAVSYYVLAMASNGSYIRSLENEADYVGLYIMHNAGYDITDIHNIWRKMSIQHKMHIDTNIFLAHTHPTTPERFLRTQKTMEEIKRGGVAQLKVASANVPK